MDLVFIIPRLTTCFHIQVLDEAYHPSPIYEVDGVPHNATIYLIKNGGSKPTNTNKMFPVLNATSRTVESVHGNIGMASRILYLSFSLIVVRVMTSGDVR